MLTRISSGWEEEVSRRKAALQLALRVGFQWSEKRVGRPGRGNSMSKGMNVDHAGLLFSQRFSLGLIYVIIIYTLRFTLGAGAPGTGAAPTWRGWG